MSSTYTIRLPEELREKMKHTDANWGEEIRSFIEERVRCLELAQLIEEIGGRADERRLKVDSTSLIREDRER
jgi:predicted DNA-binding protein